MTLLRRIIDTPPGELTDDELDEVLIYINASILKLPLAVAVVVVGAFSVLTVFSHLLALRLLGVFAFILLTGALIFGRRTILDQVEHMSRDQKISSITRHQSRALTRRLRSA